MERRICTVCERFPVEDILDLVTEDEIGFSSRGFEGRLELFIYMAKREIAMNEVLEMSEKCRNSLIDQFIQLRSPGMHYLMKVLRRNLRDARNEEEKDFLIQGCLQTIKKRWGETWIVYPFYVAPHKIEVT